MIEVKYTNTLNQLLECYVYQKKSYKSSKIEMNISRWIFTSIFLVGIIYYCASLYIVNVYDGDFTIVVILTTLISIVAIASFINHFTFPKRFLSKQKKEIMNNIKQYQHLLDEETKIKLNGDLIIVTRNDDINTIPVFSVNKVENINKFLFITFRGNFSLIIPYEAFSDENERNKFVNMILDGKKGVVQ